ncbi:hypothetical protein NH26_20125 [Flammeovirga pacifica]|uniref:DUF5689 domain-containing protein n=2 Tax=Flammeovirga pacifica TaxID=915059 RepID=A0A1S1YSC5_FLAPC|nr:hypothetical protein NH26_20125 [Flammeovirga pacifica]
MIGCVDTNYNDPKNEGISPIPEGTATISIAELKALHSGRDNDTTSISENTIIVGQIISNDQPGNIYKELYIQDNTGGILIRLDIAPIYPQFSLGQEVAIICDDLVLGSYGGNVQLGIPSLYNGTPAAGRIPGPLVDQYLIVGDTTSNITTIDATVNDLFTNPTDYIGRRVRIKNIRSADGNVSFAVKDQTTNRNFMDNSSSQRIIMRNSGYSDFAEELIPQGDGTITAIVSVFNNSPQLYINSPAQDFTDFDGTITPPNQEGVPPTTEQSIDENFDSFNKYDDIIIEGWNNIIEEGSSKWFVNEFSNNGYANLSVFRSGERRKVWLITPILDVENAANKTLSFDTREEFSTGASFKVMVSSNYDGSKAPSEFTWTELTGLTISNDGQNGYGTWTSTGDIDMSSYGNVVVAFVFDGEENIKDGGYSIDNIRFNQ